MSEHQQSSLPEGENPKEPLLHSAKDISDQFSEDAAKKWTDAPEGQRRAIVRFLMRNKMTPNELAAAHKKEKKKQKEEAQRLFEDGVKSTSFICSSHQKQTLIQTKQQYLATIQALEEQLADTSVLCEIQPYDVAEYALQCIMIDALLDGNLTFESCMPFIRQDARCNVLTDEDITCEYISYVNMLLEQKQIVLAPPHNT